MSPHVILISAGVHRPAMPYNMSRLR